MIGIVTDEDLTTINEDIRILGGEVSNLSQKLDALIKELKDERKEKEK